MGLPGQGLEIWFGLIVEIWFQKIREIELLLLLLLLFFLMEMPVGLRLNLKYGI
jgi:hypothetical protein